MQRILFAVAAGATLALGCGSIPDAKADGYDIDGVRHECDPIADSEAPYVGDPGWRQACRQSERMQNVAVGFETEGDFGPDPEEQSPDELSGNVGAAKQAITFQAGAGLSVDINASGKILGFKGACHPVSGTGSIVDNCAIPAKVNFLWEVCPHTVCGQIADSDVRYIRDRFAAAWTVWRNAIDTCHSASNDPIVTSDDARAFFKIPSCGGTSGIACGDDDRRAYNLATLPIFFEPVDSQAGFLGRTHIFSGLKVFSQTINRTKYWSYGSAGIIIDIDRVEGPLGKANSCGVTPEALGPTVFGRALARGYERILAHELGHVRGIPHLGSGLMRPGNRQTCAEIFQTPQPSSSAIGDTTAKARAVVNNEGTMALIQSMRDSSGANIAASTPNCSTSTLPSPDTNNVADFAAD